MYISVFYEGKGVGGISNAKGEYQIETHRGWNEITFSSIGYITKVIKIAPGTKVLNVKLKPSDMMLDDSTQYGASPSRNARPGAARAAQRAARDE